MTEIPEETKETNDTFDYVKILFKSFAWQQSLQAKSKHKYPNERKCMQNISQIYEYVSKYKDLKMKAKTFPRET